MKNRKIIILSAYFGQVPSCMRLFIKSCSHNKGIEYIFFTDQIIANTPENVRIIKMTLEEFSLLASKKLGIKKIYLKKPYKCCDFKPTYGTIFEDYIKGYEFWGHCDFDLVFGDVLGVIPEDAWKKYDKILPLGHLSFYRNTKTVNSRYRKEGSKVGSYDKVFTTDESRAFDEYGGIISIYNANNYPFYKEKVFADISDIHKRLKIANIPKTDMKYKLPLSPQNYKYQVFYWENGKAYRAYYDTKDKTIKQEEYAYIHFKNGKNLRVHIKDVAKCESFYITRNGFIEKKVGVRPSLSDIKELNPYKGFIYEKTEYYKYYIKIYAKKLRTIKIRNLLP